MKTHEQARASHLALQARRDALAKIRAGEIVEIRLAKDAGGQTVIARPLLENEWPGQYMVLAIVEKRLRAGVCAARKDGSDLRFESGRRLHPPRDILGVVLTVNGTSPYEGEGVYVEELRKRIEKGTQTVAKMAKGGSA